MRTLALLFLLSAGADAAAPTVVAGESAGKIRIGMERKEVRRLLGKPTLSEAVGGEEFDDFKKRGIQVKYAAGTGRVAEIFLFAGVAGGYEEGGWTAFDLRTAKGVTFRSKYEEVLAAHGEPVRKGELTKAPVPAKWLGYEGMTFEFVAATGQLFLVCIPGYVPARSP